LRLIPYTKEKIVDLKKTKRAIDSNTIAIYSSFNEYCYGVIEPIKELGKLAIKYDIGLHVDCCLGGYFFPFV